MRVRVATICILAVGLSIATGRGSVTAGTYTSAVATITRGELRRHCEFLSSDALEGRETGSRGGQAAGSYIVAHLRQHKIAAVGSDGDYYQPFLPNSRNILCRIAGSDPALAQEFVIVGAHYDHVGYGSARNSRGPIGYIHNGADDNASGTAALLELIDAFASLDHPAKRTLLFVFWDAEEQGLLGSEFWVQHPTVSFDRVRLVFNIDMVGRLRDNHAQLFGWRTAPGLRNLVVENNSAPSVAISFPWETRRDSDHYPFFARQIPYLMLFTGKHEDYHTPYDDVDKLNVEGIERVTRLLFRTVYAAAQRPQLPAFRPAALQEGPTTQESTEVQGPPPPPRLGVTWDEGLANRQILEVTQIDPGSPAEAARLEIGDRILKVGAVPIQNATELRDVIRSVPEQTTLVIQHRGDREPRPRSVHLMGPPDPIGISCRSDDAEPGCAIVSRVAVGAPGQRAGLRVHDRIHAVSALTFSNLEKFAALCLRKSGPVPLEIERDGELRTIQVTLPPQTVTGNVAPTSPR